MDRRLLIMGALAWAGCKDKVELEDTGVSRAEQLSALEALLPAWDQAHLLTTLDDATAACTAADIDAAVAALECHRDEDLTEHCTGGDEGCYAELSAGCLSRATDDISGECLQRYANSFVDSGERRRVIQPDDCRASLEGARLAAAAYEEGNEAISSYLSENLGRYSLVGSEDGGEAGGQVFLATDQDGACHVVFRGTASGIDVEQDLSSASTVACESLSGKPLGECGAGFYSQYSALRKAGAFDGIVKFLAGDSCTGLGIYGHSLGGAQASLLAADLAMELPDLEVWVYTYGEPRVFGSDDASRYDGVQKVRWSHWGDPVPSLPPASLGFRHVGTAREIYQNWSGRILFTEEDTDFAPWGYSTESHSIDAYIADLEKCP